MARRQNPTRTYHRTARVRSLVKTVVALTALVIVFGSWLSNEYLPWWSSGPRVNTAQPQLTYVVRRVVDGDTLLLANGDRVRLIGVDTPESVAPGRPVEWLGPEASQFTTRLVEGREIRLAFDKERVDRFGRILAYAYVDGVFLNETLIREGLSKAQLQYPYSSAMKRLFRDAESEAKRRRIGLWATPGLEGFRGHAKGPKSFHSQH